MTQEQLIGLAERLKLRRKEIGITQEQAAEMLGIAYSSYVKIENAYQSPGIDMLMQISLAFGLSIDYLVFGGQHRKTVEVSEITKEHIKEVAKILQALSD